MGVSLPGVTQLPGSIASAFAGCAPRPGAVLSAWEEEGGTDVIVPPVLTPEEELLLGLGDTDNPLTSPLIGCYSMVDGPRKVAGSNAISVWDDMRCNTATGRLNLSGIDTTAESASVGNMPALDALNRFTIGVWYAQTRPGTVGNFGTLFSRWHTSTAAAQQLLVDHNNGSGPRFVCCGSAGSVAVASFNVTPTQGRFYKMFWVFDGTLVGNANRLKLFRAEFNPLTQTWGAVVQLALTFVAAAIPASFLTSSVAVAARIGNFHGETAGQAFTGLIDDIRIWTGRALTQAEIDAETLDTTDAPNFRWDFVDDGALGFPNLGSTAGNNGLLQSGTFCSDDIRWTPLIAERLAYRPVWDEVNDEAEFDGVDDRLVGFEGLLARLTEDVAMGYIGTLPQVAGVDDTIADLSLNTTASILELRRAAANVLAVLGGGATQASAGAIPDALVRVLHGRRSIVVAGANQVGARLGAGAEGLNAGAATENVANRVTLAASRQSLQFAPITVKALFLYRGSDYNLRFATVNDYGVDRFGATV